MSKGRSFTVSATTWSSPGVRRQRAGALQQFHAAHVRGFERFLGVLGLWVAKSVAFYFSRVLRGRDGAKVSSPRPELPLE
jgi:hypothetical protein